MALVVREAVPDGVMLCDVVPATLADVDRDTVAVFEGVIDWLLLGLCDLLWLWDEELEIEGVEACVIVQLAVPDNVRV